MNDNSMHGWTKLIHEWKGHLWMSSMDGETSSMDESVTCGCHPWIEEPNPWMKVSSVDVIHWWRNLAYGWHRPMKMTYDGHGRTHSLASMVNLEKNLEAMNLELWLYMLWRTGICLKLRFILATLNFTGLDKPLELEDTQSISIWWEMLQDLIQGRNYEKNIVIFFCSFAS